ncbi:efflux RND transporter periplasmic adaptor subunit [Bowmanella sp. Y26]|uniref:efflux RND transporter periplasmic adaptor subunit n=1 Tax=Bowmanella yangjiangensis TaxID=2811230 RepID=UPI001BDBD5E1|nr:efflux RND transporter periplasmic adaptor subunit [Bowmanella yangjiangensis]MBT1065065.1 efflux RND transporter periplasmic adaptor subunit [Bowmanella yangjiangensis]
MQSRFVKTLIASSILISAGLMTGCGGAEATVDTAQKKVEVIAIPVEVAPLSQGDISSNYATTAILEAKEEAFVVARASGIIHEILVEEGDYVEKGQVLAKLETERYILNLKRAEANLTGIEKELNKVRDMYAKKLVSDDAYDKLSASYDAAKAELELARLDLAETTIRAPIAGFIAERNAKVGNLTESFQRERMFHIVQQKQLYGMVHLPEKELSRVHLQQAAQLDIAAANDNRVKAYVERISPVIDAKTGTFKVTLRVPNDDNYLKAGMFAQVKLNYDTHANATLLPRQAIINIDDKSSVFVVRDGIAEKVQVQTGYAEGDVVEVVNGLDGSEQVVVTGHHNLKDKAPVEVVNDVQLAKS